MADLGPPAVQVLVTPACPHAAEAERTAREVAGRLSPGSEIEVVRIETQADAARHGFVGSPTVRVGGVDVEGRGPGPPALACRTYDGAGSPPAWMVEATLLGALRPRHVLFLCVANSARSQMAEGIARSLAPEGVAVSSAGSEPTAVRPAAIEALREIGIDISGQRSKGIDEVEGEPAAVVTLCAEEVCPAWLGDAHRLHWGLPDPAGAGEDPQPGDGEGGDEIPDDAVMRRFREVRDELQRRLALLFPPARLLRGPIPTGPHEHG